MTRTHAVKKIQTRKSSIPAAIADRFQRRAAGHPHARWRWWPAFTLLWLLVCAFLLHGRPAQARLANLETERVDSEGELSSEYFNDADSYDYFYDWDSAWQASDTGLRAAAGSLNQKRFLFGREIKFERLRSEVLSKGEGIYLAFRQKHFQNEVNDLLLSEVAIGLLLFKSLEIAILGDGDSYKMSADLGVRAVWHAEAFDLGVDFWSVDHYYNSKEETGSARYAKRPRTLDVELEVRPSQAFRLILGQGKDFDTKREELEQQDVARIYAYRLERSYLGMRLRSESGTMLNFYAEHELKHERKDWVGLGRSKDLARKTLALAFSLITQHGEKLLEQHLRFRSRTANYDYRLQTDDNANLFEEATSEALEADSRRLEPSYSIRILSQDAKPDWRLAPGLHVHHVKIEDEKRVQKAEIKAELAFERRFQANGHVSIGTTWDLDQLASDFPYNEETFKPWGGGSIQFQCTL